MLRYGHDSYGIEIRYRALRGSDLPLTEGSAMTATKVGTTKVEMTVTVELTDQQLRD
jgi:hypothetical protein